MTGEKIAEDQRVFNFEILSALERSTLLSVVQGNCWAIFVLPFLPIYWVVYKITRGDHYFASWIFITLTAFAVYHDFILAPVYLVAFITLFVQPIGVLLSLKDYLAHHGCEECYFDVVEQLNTRIIEHIETNNAVFNANSASHEHYLMTEEFEDFEACDFSEFARFIGMNKFPKQYIYALFSYQEKASAESFRGALFTFDKKSPYLIVDIQELHLPEIEYE